MNQHTRALPITKKQTDDELDNLMEYQRKRVLRLHRSYKGKAMILEDKVAAHMKGRAAQKVLRTLRLMKYELEDKTNS
jgi:hypothetical protein